MKKKTKTLKKKTSKKGAQAKRKTKVKSKSKKVKRAPKLRAKKRKLTKKKSKFNVIVRKSKKKIGAKDSSYVQELPFSYNETKLALLPRDPDCVFLYWDFSEKTWEWIQNLYSEHHSLWPKIRLHPQGDPEYFEMDVSLDSRKWYVHIAAAGQTLFAELGLLDEQGNFYLIAKSNWIKVPRNTPSDVIDPDWAPFDFETLYRLSGGASSYGVSSWLTSPEIVPEKSPK